MVDLVYAHVKAFSTYQTLTQADIAIVIYGMDLTLQTVLPSQTPCQSRISMYDTIIFYFTIAIIAQGPPASSGHDSAS